MIKTILSKCAVLSLLAFAPLSNAIAYEWIPPTPQVVEIVAASMDKAIDGKDKDAIVFTSILAQSYAQGHADNKQALNNFRQFVGCVTAKIGGLEGLHIVRFADAIEAMKTSGGLETYFNSLPPEAKQYGEKLADLHAIAYHCDRMANEPNYQTNVD